MTTRSRNRPKRRKASLRKFVAAVVRSRMEGSSYYRKRVERVGFDRFVDAELEAIRSRDDSSEPT